MHSQWATRTIIVSTLPWPFWIQGGTWLIISQSRMQIGLIAMKWLCNWWMHMQTAIRFVVKRQRYQAGLNWTKYQHATPSISTMIATWLRAHCGSSLALCCCCWCALVVIDRPDWSNTNQQPKKVKEENFFMKVWPYKAKWAISASPAECVFA